MIRKGEVTYPDVDAALEKVGKVQILDWLGDKLAADDLKKPVESLLQKIMAESSDRAAKPSNDVINEVQPLKWKKAPHGEAQPQNLPMNPDAKSPSAPMDGMPVKSMLAKILAEFPPNDSDSKPALSEHNHKNLEDLEIAFNRFINEEMREADEHGQANLEQLKNSFAIFLDQEMKEA